MDHPRVIVPPTDIAKLQFEGPVRFQSTESLISVGAIFIGILIVAGLKLVYRRGLSHWSSSLTMRDFRIFGREAGALVGKIFKWTLGIAVALVVLGFAALTFVDWGEVTWGSVGKATFWGVIGWTVWFTVEKRIFEPIAEIRDAVDGNRVAHQSIYSVLTKVEEAVARLEGSPDFRPRGGR